MDVCIYRGGGGGGSFALECSSFFFVRSVVSIPMPMHVWNPKLTVSGVGVHCGVGTFHLAPRSSALALCSVVDDGCVHNLVLSLLLRIVVAVIALSQKMKAYRLWTARSDLV